MVSNNLYKRFLTLYHLIHRLILVLHFQSIGHNQPIDTMKCDANHVAEMKVKDHIQLPRSSSKYYRISSNKRKFGHQRKQKNACST
ncbi:hypothetical protein BpHYR1_051348 [Brachionus plicatilis]|uniref:Uncharacterized protein n=1 Tax=Brachionus plicatilis TaxID=10195 RepID=A0A3M7PW51_BRAPC|nr:hypothetical protein BpHYR1_051348 [Brachionus plicatilis]